MPKLPWTREELDQLIPKIEAQISEIEDTRDGPVKPLPVMTLEECMRFFLRMLDVAKRRALSDDECFLMGQLLACYRMAVRADMLGKQGRFYVVAEDDIAALMRKP